MATKSLQDLSLYLTEKCNLNCSYCYIKKNFKSTLSFGDVQKAVDIFYDHCSSLTPPTVTILGGEPLLVYPLLVETIDYLNEKFGGRVQIIVFTNGTLLTSKIARALLSKKARIFVSLDGIKKVNDCYRKYYHSPEISTFDAVIKNLKSLPPSTRNQIGVNMVAGPKTVSFLTRNIKFFQKLGLSPIDFSLLCYGLWKESEIAAAKKELKKFVKFYAGLFSSPSKGKIFRTDVLEQMVRKNNTWEQMSDCHRVKFAADKNFYFCDAFFSLPPKERLKYKVGDLKTGINVKKICGFVGEASLGLSKIKHPSHFWHKKHKRAYCPFSIYFYTKFNGQNLARYLDSFYRMSDIYTAVFAALGKMLKNNEKFNAFYFKKDGDIFSDNL